MIPCSRNGLREERGERGKGEEKGIRFLRPAVGEAF